LGLRATPTTTTSGHAQDAAAVSCDTHQQSKRSYRGKRNWSVVGKRSLGVETRQADHDRETVD
jgi:hypothetical protein